MLDNSIYVNHSDLHIHTLDEMCKYMNKYFFFTGSTLRDVVLVLCTYCLTFSQEELAQLFKSYSFSSHLSTRVFKPLINDGYLIAERASTSREQEGTARIMYSVTRQGYEAANSLCQGKLFVDYKARRSKVAKSHSYYLGYSLINMMLLNYPLTWHRELLYENKPHFKKARVQVDGECNLYDVNCRKPFYTVYIEQDLGTERTYTLYEKLENYANLGLLVFDQMLVFSFSQKGTVQKRNTSSHLPSPYNIPKLKKIIEFLDLFHIDDVYGALLIGYPDRAFITSFLIKVGGAKVHKSELQKTSIQITRQFIVEFIDSLNERRNPYQQRDLNIQRAKFANSRLFDMIKYVYKCFGDIYRNGATINNLRLGAQVYFVPTTLLSDRIKYAMPHKFNSVVKKLSTSLNEFGSVKYINRLSDFISLGKDMDIKLRNVFSTSIGKVCIEYACFDLGAWIRALYFIKHLPDDDPIHLIIVVETIEQLTDFYRANGCYIDHFDKEKSQILFLRLSDIGRPCRVFYCQDDSLKMHFITSDNL